MIQSIDILCVGEIIIDLIGHEKNVNLCNTDNFHKILGGSPTNVAQNAMALGLKSVIVGTCGKDGFGNFIIDELSKKGIDTNYIRQNENSPTSIICVSKSTDTPEFIPYRSADFLIENQQLPDELIKNTKVFHTTCFALSLKPARETIINKAKIAQKYNKLISIDLNYSNKIWDNKPEAISVIKDYLSLKPVLKVSEDDSKRLFGETKSENFIFNYFHDNGAELVCYTKGKNGVILSGKDGQIISKNAMPIENVVDSTGAGDAFWTGFLYGLINKFNHEKCLDIAQKVAVFKLQNVGTLNKIDLSNLPI